MKYLLCGRHHTRSENTALRRTVSFFTEIIEAYKTIKKNTKILSFLAVLSTTKKGKEMK